MFAFLIFAFGFIPGLAYATFIAGTLPVVFDEAERMFPQAFSQLTETPALEGGGRRGRCGGCGCGRDGTPAPSASSTDGAPEGDSASIAVVQIKQMQRAQAAYASLNEGYYDRLECVLTPSMCIRNGDERNKAVLLDQSFIPPQRHGYTFLLNTVRRARGAIGDRVSDQHARLFLSRDPGVRKRRPGRPTAATRRE